ncbi:hypothetical protein [Algoriphagus boritolerans]|uniref:hypothetical protein n=1 Tax=Algoriphagus boritolerans TaxID=308111 RepID=UPI000AE38E01
MIKQVVLILLLGIGANSYAQSEFNNWSIEINGGFNKPMGPLTPGYLSPTLNLGHLDIGGRHMINEYVGLKGNLGFGTFREAKDVSPDFTSNYLTLTAEGVGNFGRMLNFESFTKKNWLVRTSRCRGRKNFLSRTGNLLPGAGVLLHYHLRSYYFI